MHWVKKTGVFCIALFLLLLPSCTMISRKPAKKNVNLFLSTPPLSLDPRIGGNRISQIIIRELFEGLTRIGKDGNAHLALAEAFSLSENKTTYTFYLHPSKWSNGSDVTANDFIWAWKSVLDHSVSTSFSYPFFIIKNAKKAYHGDCSLNEIGLKAIDALTLEIKLEHPAPYFLELISNPIFSPVCQKQGDSSMTKSYPDFISNGPFILEEYDPESHIILEKNPYYWNPDVPQPDQISFPIIDDPETAYGMFEDGELDWFGEPFLVIPHEIHSRITKKYRPTCVDNNWLTWLICNVEKPHLASAKIRHALASAINREQFCSLFLQRTEHPAFSIIPNSLSLLKKKPFEDNAPIEAKRLFEEGISELGYTRETYPCIEITVWNNSHLIFICEMLQMQIEKALQTPVRLKVKETPDFWEQVSRKEGDLTFFLWGPWFNDPIYTLNYLREKQNGINAAGWESPTYAHLLSAADNTTDIHLRTEYLKAAEELAMEEIPIIPLFATPYEYVKKPCIHGEVVNSLGVLELKWLEKDS